MVGQRWKTVGVTVLAVLVLEAAVGLVIMYSGVIDIAATKPHYALTEWVLETTMDRSVERREEGIKPPAVIRAGSGTLRYYREACELCHGGPGIKPTEIGKGLRPQPPDLLKAAGDMRDTEIFWIVRNGIRMTGMPSFGITYPDAKLWEMVALVKSLPRMPPQEYLKISGNR